MCCRHPSTSWSKVGPVVRPINMLNLSLFLCVCIACSDPSLSSSSSWFGRLEASGWLGHVARLLKAAKTVVMALHHDGEYSTL